MGALIGIFGGIIIFAILFFVLSKISYKNKFKNKYNIRNMFPYELNYKGKFSDNLYGNITLILFSCCSIAFFVLFDNSYIDGWNIAIMIIGILLSICVSLLIFIPLGHTKVHIGVTAIFFVLSAALPSLIAINDFNYFQNTTNYLFLVLFIISTILVIVLVILVFNPKLSYKINPIKKENEDGTISYIRPKTIYICFVEWLLIFMFLIDEIILLISTVAK